MKIVYWLAAICFCTASCDLILNFDLGGQVRLSQFLMVPICLAAIGFAIQNGRVLWPRGAGALALWLLGQAVFMPFCGVLSIGLKFFALMAFTFAGYLAIVQLYGQSLKIEQLMRLYINSFVVIAGCGLIQFILPLFGVIAPYTQQWIRHGRLARINAFSYEPSYFATYMAIGWIMIVDLRLSGASIVQGRYWKWATIAITASLLLATSKTGWIIMILEVLSRLAPHIWRGLRRVFRSGRLPLPIPSPRGIAFMAVAAIGITAGASYLHAVDIDPVIFFFSGSGIGGTAAHSTVARLDGLNKTFDAFMDSPFIGRTLGGVAIYIASRDGVILTTMDDQYRLYWGFPIILDLFVASGCIGVIPFLVFLYRHTAGGVSMALRYWPQERAKWLRALARAMIFEWIMLLADQNLLRVYLWLHFTMIAVVAYHLEFNAEPEPVQLNRDTPHFPLIEVPAAQ